MNLDFFMAIQKHHLWRIQLKAFLLGLQDLSANQAADHAGCQLGKWLYEYGLNAYPDIREVADLEEIHQQLHHSAQEIIAAKKSNDLPKAKELYGVLAKTSDELERLMNSIEEKIWQKTGDLER